MQDVVDTTQEPEAIQVLKQWDLMSKYVSLDTVKKLERAVRAMDDVGTISLDTETTGLDTITANCLGYSFSDKAHEAFWVPYTVDPQLKLLKKLVKGKVIIFFNAGYDLAIIEKYGVRVPEKYVRDVMIACFFRDIDGYKRNAGLKKQSKIILSLPTVELKEILMANMGVAKLKSDDVDFTLLEPWQQRVYGCQDADITIQLWQDKSIQKAVNMMPEIWELEHQLIQPVMSMYKNGVGVDLKMVAELDAALEQECQKCSKQVLTAAFKECETETITTAKGKTKTVFCHEELARLTKKKDLNLGSFVQKQILLFELLGLPRTHRTATGWSTDQHALSFIKNEHEIVPILMRYNRMASRRNSYTKKLPSKINIITGRHHPSLWATGTKSGRFSCSNINMQGISKDHAADDPVRIRKIFVPGKGNVLTSADYSQVELRVVASLSGEPVLCKAYIEGNIDAHQQTAANMYKIPFADVTIRQREIAKIVNFSILICVGAKKLSNLYNDTMPTEAVAQGIIDEWYAALPVLGNWVEKTKQIVYMRSEMRTYFGRIRPFPEIHSPYPASIAKRIEVLRERDWAREKSDSELHDVAIRSLQASDERAALSLVIQGTAADIMKIGIVRVHRAIRKAKMPVKMLLTVHDELLFEHSPKITKEFHALLREQLTWKEFGPAKVPLPIDIGTGKNWDAAH